jgi:Xaa-Pro aminopeptidase
MLNDKLDAIIIPTADPHQSEYIPHFWKIREWLTGFTGSAGTAVITKHHAGLWTDSRYFIQAENQLITPFELHKLKTRTPEYINWLNQELTPGAQIGINPWLFSASQVNYFKEQLATKNITIQLVPNLIETLWNERPTLIANKIFVHKIVYAGETVFEKLETVKKHLIEKNATHMLIAALDEIAWLFNIRGSDIEYNPVATAYCLVTHTQPIIYIDSTKIDDAVRTYFNDSQIVVKSYDSILDDLKNLNKKQCLICDSSNLNAALFNEIPNHCTIIDEQGITGKLKAIKNQTEIENYRSTQERDGVAMCNFLHWLENQITENKQLTEWDAAIKVEAFRNEQEHYYGPSFAPISAYQQNAALPHYSVSRTNHATLKPEGLYLIDSGGQYFDGTTDITRTIAMGKVTEEQITDYTLVLKGHIRLAMAKFPEGTKGFHLDTLSRLDLWQHGKDFGHGTGHGIGFFLNVHEGPQGFAQASTGNPNTNISQGMFITNEPGIYHENKYGIRIENVLICKKSNEAGFLSFETVTYCPLDKQLINKKMLTIPEINWIDNYHDEVYQRLHNKLPKPLKKWLADKTSPLNSAPQ